MMGETRKHNSKDRTGNRRTEEIENDGREGKEMGVDSSLNQGTTVERNIRRGKGR